MANDVRLDQEKTEEHGRARSTPAAPHERNAVCVRSDSALMKRKISFILSVSTTICSGVRQTITFEGK